MATSILPFNIVFKGGTTSGVNDVVSRSEFVNGSGTLELSGSDVLVSTADGLIHFVRLSIDRKAQFSGYDNLMSHTSGLTTNANLADPDAEVFHVGFHTGSTFTEFYARRGIMHGSFSAEQMITTFEIVFDSEIYPLT